jgi:iron complex outermembrane receptor protein
MRTFNIPAQSLGTAITAFGRQAGIQVTVDASISRGVQTQGVAGTMTASQALNQLLAGTGIVAQFTSDRDVMLTKPQSGQLPPGVMQLDPVQVQGYPVPPQAMIDNIPPPYAGGQVATGGQLGLLGNRDVMDTPFNQTSYTAKKAQDQQAKTVRNVLIDDPSVRALYPDGGFGNDAVYIRGFPVYGQDMAYGGLYGLLSTYSPMSELADRVELLKGPSAMLNGMSPSGVLGGTINVVPKRAPAGGLTQLNVDYTSDAQFGGHVDIARRFGPDEIVGVRFNGVFRAGQTAIDNNTDQRALAVLGLDFRGEYARFSADLGYQYQYIGGVIPYVGLADGVPLPWAPAARKNFGQLWNNTDRKDAFGVVRGEFDLTETITAYAALGARDSRIGILTGGNSVVVDDFNGNATAGGFRNSAYVQSLTGEVGVRGRTETGPIGHEFALTASTLETTSGVGFVGGPAYTTNIYNPTFITQPSIPTPAANKVSTGALSGIGIADTLLAANKRIQLTVGARLQQVTANNFNITTGQPTSGYNESALSPAVALVFKPWENVSVYGNWIQGLQQGTVVGSTFANAGEIFPPFKTTQYEVGIKADWGRFTTTASLFQITQPFTLADVATNTLLLGGEQRNQGLEFNVFGEPIEGVRLLGGIMLLNAVLTRTQGGTTDGWTAPFSPGFNLNLAGEWDLPFVPGLTLNGRVMYTSSQYIDTAWPRRSLPEWTRFDLGARYAFENPGAKGKLLIARFNVENVLDADYWAGGGSSDQLVLGAPRTFRLSLTADF